MSTTVITPQDAIEIGRAIERGSGEISDLNQRRVALLVAHRLTSTQKNVVVKTNVSGE